MTVAWSGVGECGRGGGRGSVLRLQREWRTFIEDTEGCQGPGSQARVRSVAEASGRACAQHMGITYDGATMLSSISVLFSQHWGHERSHFKVRTARQISAVWWAWAAQPPSQPPALMFAVAAGSLRGRKNSPLSISRTVVQQG
jgi:hypothetical protein